MTTPDDSADALLSILRQTVVGLVKRDGPDLSARQLAISLVCYAEDEAQTVRGLAKQLNISKAAVSRGLDRLMEFDLIRRKDDPRDRRSILVQRTPNGHSLLRELRGILKKAAAQTQRSVPAQSVEATSSRRTSP